MFSSLRNRNYRLFWSAQAISLTGSWMQTIGLAWLVLRLTNRADTLGFVTMLQFMPILLFALVGGVVADRVPKRRFLMLTQTTALIQAAVLGFLVSEHLIRLWHIYILAVIAGLVAAFDNPTRQAFVVEMVGREDLPNAVALNSGLFNATRIVGPAIGGLIIESALGISGTFLLNAASYVPAVIALVMMREKELKHSAPSNRGAVIPQVVEGFRYCFSRAETTLIMVMLAVIGTFGYNFSVALPLLARFALRVGSQGLGWLTAAMGLGSLCGAFYLARRTFYTHRLLLFGSGAFSIMLGALAFRLPLHPELVLLVAMGFASIVFNATGNTLLQMSTPDALRGRVMSIFFLLLAGSTPIGGFLTGVLAAHIQIRETLGLEAIICGAGVVWGIGYYWRKQMIRSDRSPAVTRVRNPRMKVSPQSAEVEARR